LIAERLRERGHFVSQLTDEYIRDLERSAPLHDIGKVGIPDSVLLKPGKLNAREWAIMKTHAEIGAATLEGVILQNSSQDFLLMGCEIARCHHERWDGGGYPAGLKGEEIPLSARILALADVYDALTSVRPYKAAWTHEEALSWVEEHSGSHFDPTVITAFLGVAEQANSIRARLADRPEDFEDKPVLRSLRRTA
jgi:putative two-component system response regulator